MSVASTTEAKETKTDPMAERAAEIRAAVQTLLDAIDDWSASEHEYFTEKLETSISAALSVILNGDMPAAVMGLFAKCVVLGEIWVKVQAGEDGILTDDGLPGRPFWDAIRALREAYESVDAIQRRGIEPVAELLQQLKDHPHKYEQIARIYGRYDAERDKFVGPFYFKNGSPNVEAIEKEGREPGSVVPAGYDPLAESQSKARQAGLSALAKVRKRLAETQGQPVDKDPATVEQLLREGQFPDVIAFVKGVSEKSVRDTAGRLGIKIREREEILDEAFRKFQEDARNSNGDRPYLDAIESLTSSAVDLESVDDSSADDSAELGDEDPEPSRADTALTGEDLRAFVEMCVSDNPEISTSQVMHLIQEDGQTASAIAVGRILSGVRKAAAEQQ